MVSIPAIKDSLFGVVGYRACLMEWALSAVKHLEVDCALRLAILLCTYNNAVASGDRFSNRDWFKDTQGYVVVKSCFNILLPMEWYWYGCVLSNRFCNGVYHEPHRNAPHQG